MAFRVGNRVQAVDELGHWVPGIVKSVNNNRYSVHFVNHEAIFDRTVGSNEIRFPVPRTEGEKTKRCMVLCVWGFRVYLSAFAVWNLIPSIKTHKGGWLSMYAVSRLRLTGQCYQYHRLAGVKSSLCGICVGPLIEFIKLLVLMLLKIYSITVRARWFSSSEIIVFVHWHSCKTVVFKIFSHSEFVFDDLTHHVLGSELLC